MKEPDSFLRVPDTKAGEQSGGPAVQPAFQPLTWPLDHVTQQTLRRWFAGTTSGETGGSGSGHIILDEGGAPPLPQRKYLDFRGDLIAATDDAPNDSTIVRVTGDLVRYAFIPAEAMAPATTNGCADLAQIEAASNDVDYWVLDFDPTTEESAFCTFRMSPRYNGESIGVGIVWTSTGGGADETVTWGIKGIAYSDGASIDQAYGSEATTTDTRIGDDVIQMADEVAFNAANQAQTEGQWMQFKISRKVGSDTLAVDARLIGIRLQWNEHFT